MKKEHLSYYGIGPYYVWTIMILSVIAVILSYKNIIPTFTNNIYSILSKILGSVFFILFLIIWSLSVFVSKIDKNIKENNLVTTGIYAYVRNPIYSAMMFCSWGILLWGNNMYILILAPLYWILMTIMVKYTEEKWLLKLYGDEYAEHCKKVNRCFPWF